MNAVDVNQSGLMGLVSGMGPFVPMYSSGGMIATADSGITFNNFSGGAAVSVPRKRAREATGGDRMLSFLGEDMSSHMQHQMQEVDRLIVYHAEKVRVELLERRRRFLRQALAAVDDGVAKRLKAKEEEIQRIAKLNWALEERIRSLCVENQIWRDLAQTNEAAATVLRNNLEQVLLAAQVRDRECETAAAAEDAESCCCGENCEEERDTATATDWKRRVCRNCGDGEPSVLLLPCRHLCLCSACGPVVNACPVCKCSKDGSVNVNIV